jgi:hypothetical protein
VQIDIDAGNAQQMDGTLRLGGHMRIAYCKIAIGWEPTQGIGVTAECTASRVSRRGLRSLRSLVRTR